MYNPYLSSKLNIEELSSNKDESAGTAIVCIMLNVLVVPLSGSSWIKRVTVASAVAWTLVSNIEKTLENNYEFELILVNDSSEDNSEKKM